MSPDAMIQKMSQGSDGWWPDTRAPGCGVPGPLTGAERCVSEAWWSVNGEIRTCGAERNEGGGRREAGAV